MPQLEYVLKSDALYQNPDRVFSEYHDQAFKDFNRSIPAFRKYSYKQETNEDYKNNWPHDVNSFALQLSVTDPQTIFLYNTIDQKDIKDIKEKFPNAAEEDIKNYKLLATYAYQIHLINQKHFKHNDTFDYSQDFIDFITPISADNIKMICLLNQGFFGYAAITNFKGLGGFFPLTTPYMNEDEQILFSTIKPEIKQCEFKIDQTGIHCNTTVEAEFTTEPTSVIQPTKVTTTYTVDINCKEEKQPTTQPYVKATFTQNVDIQDYALYLLFSQPPKKSEWDSCTFVPDNTTLMPLLEDFLSKLMIFDNSLTEQQTNKYKTFWFKKFLYCTTLTRCYEPTLGGVADMHIPKNIKITALACVINEFAREGNLKGISTITKNLDQNDIIQIANKLITTDNGQAIPSIINSLNQQKNNYQAIYQIINNLTQQNKKECLTNIVNNLPKIDFSKFTQNYNKIDTQAQKANLQNKAASIGATIAFIITYFIITKLASYILLTKIALGCFAAGSILYAFLSILNLYKFSKNKININLPENIKENLITFKNSNIKNLYTTYCASAIISLLATVLLFSMASMQGIVILSYLGSTSYLLSINAAFSLFVAKITHKGSKHRFSQIAAYTSIACSAIFAPLIANPITLTWIFAFNIALITITNTAPNTPTIKTTALRIINILSILLFYLSISAQASMLIFAAPALSIFTVFLQIYLQNTPSKTSCCKSNSCNKHQDIEILELNKMLTQENITTLNNHKKGINISDIKASTKSTTIQYSNPNKLTKHQIISGIKHLLKIDDLNLKQKKSNVNTNNIKIISIGFVVIYLAHIYLPQLLPIQLLLASITLCLLFLQDNFYENSKKTIKKFYPAIIGITTSLLLFNAAPINVIFAAISLLSLSIAIKFKQLDTSIACFVLCYLLIKFATTNPIIVSGFILITSFIFCIIQSKQIKMQQAQNISIILILITQVAGLFFPALGFPMACWHHAILMQSVLEINKIIKQSIKSKLKTQPLSNNPTLFDLPLKQTIIHDDYYDCSIIKCERGQRLSCDALVRNDNVLIDLETVTGQKGANVLARIGSILPRGTKILSDCQLEVFDNEENNIEITTTKPFEFITNNIITILFVFALLASIYAWIVGSSIISAFCTVLILVCPCVFSTINSSIEYAAIHMLDNSVAINEKNTILDSLLLISNSLSLKKISFDKTGTLSQSRPNKEFPEIKTNSRPLINKLIQKNFSIQIITGADNKEELNKFKKDLEETNGTQQQQQIKLQSISNKKSLQNKSAIHIGDGANDIEAWNEDGLGICLPHTPDAIAQNFHFQMKNENWQADLLKLFNVSKWAKYSLFTSYIAVILYSIICTILAAIGIITPMISCLLLCSLSVITPGFIILSSQLYSPAETINETISANIDIEIIHDNISFNEFDNDHELFKTQIPDTNMELVY